MVSAVKKPYKEYDMLIRMKATWDEIILLAASIILLLALACQYPASTTFPIGGDAAAYVGKMTTILHYPLRAIGVITSSWYPGMFALFAPAALLPFIDWPTRFTLWMTLGQIITGLMMGLLCYRIGGLKSAAAGIAVWALTPIVLTPFYEDGTLAQLWSLPWVILFFERYLSGSTIGVLIALLLVTLTHPISGLVLFITITLAAVPLWNIRLQISAQSRSIVHYLLIVCGLMTICLITIFTLRSAVFSIEAKNEHSAYAQELSQGSFLPWSLLALVGYISLARKYASSPDKIILFGSFTFISFLLAFNDLLGVGFWTPRLASYLLLAVIMGAAYILPIAGEQVWKKQWLYVVFFLLLFSSLGSGVWRENSARYNYYESPSRYGRLLRGERSAITWLQANVPTGSQIYSSMENRNTEWISALSTLPWTPITSDPVQHIINTSKNVGGYAIYFTHRENLPTEYVTDTIHYRVLYHNDAAAVVQVL